jgi:hypothetical protein
MPHADGGACGLTGFGGHGLTDASEKRVLAAEAAEGRRFDNFEDNFAVAISHWTDRHSRRVFRRQYLLDDRIKLPRRRLV